MERSGHPDGHQALEAARRLSAMLETIRASASDWTLDPAAIKALGDSVERDPAVGALLAVTLDQHTRSRTTSARDCAAIADRIEALINAIQSG